MASWRRSALYYLTDVWDTYDRHFVPAFSSGPITAGQLHSLCVEYGVVRSIPGNINELGMEGRSRPFLDALNRYCNTVVTKANTAAIIDREVANLAKAYGKQPWSAVSKAF